MKNEPTMLDASAITFLALLSAKTLGNVDVPWYELCAPIVIYIIWACITVIRGRR